MAGARSEASALWLVPAAELVVGALFSLGLLARLASLASAGMMVVATYVHLVVHDPTLFPLQPEAPMALRADA